MSKYPKPIRPGNPPKSSAPKPGIPRVTFIVLLAVAAGGTWWWKSRPTNAPTPTPPPVEAAITNAPATVAAAAASKADFQKLTGKWQRPDGGYVIDVKSVTDQGAMDAGYFNPKPIHVAKAEATQDGAALKVFIELRDVNYPGSTYTLVYDPAGDQLKGIYYQALQQQSFEVVFVRLK
jgi:hypothetical protein